jgi:hypothetical protein
VGDQISLRTKSPIGKGDSVEGEKASMTKEAKDEWIHVDETA